MAETEPDFAELGVAGPIVASLAAAGITHPFPIQALTLPVALSGADIIGQAKGIIMERYSCDAEHAFDLLKRLSQETNNPLRDLARQLVESDRPNADPDGDHTAQTAAPANP